MADFSELRQDIQAVMDADLVVVAPPFVFVRQGERRTRYWLPQPVSTVDLDNYTLRAVPPNARLRRSGNPNAERDP